MRRLTQWPGFGDSASLDMMLMCLGPLALVVLGALISGLRYNKNLQPKAPLVWGTTLFSVTDLVLSVVTILIFLALLAVRLHLLSDDRLEPWWQCVPSLLRTLRSSRRLWLTLWSFVGGIVVGVVVRLYLGGLNVATFCNASSPLIAGLLVAIIFQGSQVDKREATASQAKREGNGSQVDKREATKPADPAVRLQRQLGVLYILSGAVCAALGNIPARGWFFRACFLVVCGSLAASCYVVTVVVLDEPPQ